MILKWEIWLRKKENLYVSACFPSQTTTHRIRREKVTIQKQIFLQEMYCSVWPKVTTSTSTVEQQEDPTGNIITGKLQKKQHTKIGLRHCFHLSQLVRYMPKARICLTRRCFLLSWKPYKCCTPVFLPHIKLFSEHTWRPRLMTLVPVKKIMVLPHYNKNWFCC